VPGNALDCLLGILFIFIEISSVPSVLLANVLALFFVSLTVVYAPG